MSSKHSDLVNCVSEFLFRAWFLFYDKKRETFMLTKKNLRHSSLDHNVGYNSIEGLSRAEQGRHNKFWDNFNTGT